MPDQQTIFADFKNIQQVRKLTPNQRKILSLLSCGLQQADVAKRLNFSRPYVNQVVKKMEGWNLVKRIRMAKQPAGVRPYTYFYEVAAEAKVPDLGFTPYRVHYIRRNFKILNLSEPVSTDPKRTSFLKSWRPRGGERHKFWYDGKAGYPRVTLDIHPGKMVAYVDKGQKILAESMEQAQEIGWFALFQAKDKFVMEQERLGIHIDIERVGTPVGKPHAGLVLNEKGPFMKQEPKIPGLWIDKSVESEMGPGMYELEGYTDHQVLTEAEQGLMAAVAVKKTLPAIEAMPEALKEITARLDPLQQNVLRVEAALQGGLSMSKQHELMVGFMTKALDEMAALRQENAEMKRALGMK